MDLVVRHQGRECRVTVLRTRDPKEGYRVVVGESTYLVDLAVLQAPALHSLLIDGRQSQIAVDRLGQGRYRVSSPGATSEVEVQDPLTFLARQSHEQGASKSPQLVTAYMPGRVAALLVAAGEAVTRGQGVVVLEAMKMENEIQADADGVVRRILVEEGQAVEAGDPLFELG